MQKIEVLSTTTAPSRFYCNLGSHFSRTLSLVLSLMWRVWWWKINTEHIQKMNSLPNMFKSLLPSLTASCFVQPHVGHWPACSLVLCPGRQLVCLKPTHWDTQTCMHTHRQRWTGREGGCEGHIHRPWNRAGLAQVRASQLGHLSGIWVFQGSDVKVSTMWTTWPMTRLLNYVCNTLAFQQHSLLALLRKHPVFDPIKSCCHHVECIGNITLPSIGDVFNRLQSPWISS